MPLEPLELLQQMSALGKTGHGDLLRAYLEAREADVVASVRASHDSSDLLRCQGALIELRELRDALMASAEPDSDDAQHS